MHQQRLEDLFQKYFDKTASDSERTELMQYINVSSDEEIESWMKNAFNSNKSIENFFLQSERNKILQTIFKEESQESENCNLRRKLYKESLRKYVALAAILFIIAALGIIIYRSGFHQIDTTTSVSPVNIVAGTNKAILTLADGSIIQLNDVENGKIANQEGIIISKTDEGQLTYSLKESIVENPLKELAYNTISTPKGGQFQVVLPDGTKVWLNAMSILRYPVLFMDDERVVELEGEGYFEVARNTKQPFKVITDNQTVTVLGTHFNINSYKSESIKTTLLEGSVKISGSTIGETKEAKSVILKPGQQASIGSSNILKVKNVNVDNAIAWKLGVFQFENTNIKDVMEEFSRWYDVDVDFDKGVPNINLWGRVYRNVNAAEALEILSYFNLKYKVIQTTNKITGQQRKKIIVSYN